MHTLGGLSRAHQSATLFKLRDAHRYVNSRPRFVTIEYTAWFNAVAGGSGRTTSAGLKTGHYSGVRFAPSGDFAGRLPGELGDLQGEVLAVPLTSYFWNLITDYRNTLDEVLFARVVATSIRLAAFA
jgi:hypothetical protein